VRRILLKIHTEFKYVNLKGRHHLEDKCRTEDEIEYINEE
jgi:hypothetical protein